MNVKKAKEVILLCLVSAILCISRFICPLANVVSHLSLCSIRTSPICCSSSGCFPFVMCVFHPHELQICCALSMTTELRHLNSAFQWSADKLCWCWSFVHPIQLVLFRPCAADRSRSRQLWTK
ncbi:hypothetical protein CRM22_010688 [Opisthorchis felineus]|uniref:Uncharacterized protein n=1 Tax=Opisthorchis felineus TaxID=147828 RepID=A0A4S2KQJ1_OPIFE|nr:hypothetical protein CRM22_010688 [Opisthorchis felineus]